MSSVNRRRIDLDQEREMKTKRQRREEERDEEIRIRKEEEEEERCRREEERKEKSEMSRKEVRDWLMRVEEQKWIRQLQEQIEIEERKQHSLWEEQLKVSRLLEEMRLNEKQKETRNWRDSKPCKQLERPRGEQKHDKSSLPSSSGSSSRPSTSKMSRERALEKLQKEVIAINNKEPQITLPCYSEQHVGMREPIPNSQQYPITVNCKLFGSLRLFPLEIQKLPQLVHNNIISTIGFLTSEDDYLMLEMPGGERLIEYFTSKTIFGNMLLSWALNIARGLHYLHSRNLAHGALFQKNIFTHGDRLKLESPMILNKWKKDNFADLWDTTLDLYGFALLLDQLLPQTKMADSADIDAVEHLRKLSRDVQRNIQNNVEFRSAMTRRSGRIDQDTAYRDLIARFQTLPMGTSPTEALYTIEHIVSILEDKIPDEYE